MEDGGERGELTTPEHKVSSADSCLVPPAIGWLQVGARRRGRGGCGGRGARGGGGPGEAAGYQVRGHLDGGASPRSVSVATREEEKDDDQEKTTTHLGQSRPISA